MKLGTIVYLHDTFHLAKDLDVTHRASQDEAEKLLKKAQKIGSSAPFLGIFNNISKPVPYVILCFALHHW